MVDPFHGLLEAPPAAPDLLITGEFPTLYNCHCLLPGAALNCTRSGDARRTPYASEQQPLACCHSPALHHLQTESAPLCAPPERCGNSGPTRAAEPDLIPESAGARRPTPPRGLPCAVPYLARGPLASRYFSTVQPRNIPRRPNFTDAPPDPSSNLPGDLRADTWPPAARARIRSAYPLPSNSFSRRFSRLVASKSNTRYLIASRT